MNLSVCGTAAPGPQDGALRVEGAHEGAPLCEEVTALPLKCRGSFRKVLRVMLLPHRLCLFDPAPPISNAERHWIMALEVGRRPLEITWSRSCTLISRITWRAFPVSIPETEPWGLGWVSGTWIYKKHPQLL